MELPHFMGPPGWVGEVLKSYNQLAPLLQKKGLYIHELGCDARLAWYMVLNNGMTLKLGRGDSKTKLMRFIKFYNYLVTQKSRLSQKNPVLLMDLRYTNGLAVQTVPY
ncbi:Cell division protein FtsQ [Beggiatoa sp. PS]|nr:Cell division protein FtsQ [Beggiatoa sp. PS]